MRKNCTQYIYSVAQPQSQSECAGASACDVFFFPSSEWGMDHIRTFYIYIFILLTNTRDRASNGYKMMMVKRNLFCCVVHSFRQYESLHSFGRFLGVSAWLYHRTMAYIHIYLCECVWGSFATLYVLNVHCISFRLWLFILCANKTLKAYILFMYLISNPKEKDGIFGKRNEIRFRLNQGVIIFLFFCFLSFTHTHTHLHTKKNIHTHELNTHMRAIYSVDKRCCFFLFFSSIFSHFTVPLCETLLTTESIHPFSDLSRKMFIWPKKIAILNEIRKSIAD